MEVSPQTFSSPKLNPQPPFAFKAGSVKAFWNLEIYLGTSISHQEKVCALSGFHCFKISLPQEELHWDSASPVMSQTLQGCSEPEGRGGHLAAPSPESPPGCGAGVVLWHLSAAAAFLLQNHQKRTRHRQFVPAPKSQSQLAQGVNHKACGPDAPWEAIALAPIIYAPPSPIIGLSPLEIMSKVFSSIICS